MIKAKKIKRTFHDELILNQWLLSLFNQRDLTEFKARLGNDRFEGINDEGQTRFFDELQSSLFHTDHISLEDLRRYDLNIVRHWQQITEKRNEDEGHILQLKYFQYLSLLFTEIYLDYYFNRPNELLAELNEHLIFAKNEPNTPDFQPYEYNELNKLAFWNATGSGKTLLMHVNILQYQHYQGRNDLNIFVITPNEGLSQQHLNEFSASGMEAMLFDKNKGQSLFNEIQILDINKLADKEGDVTVAVDYFSETNKLVLVDEGHRGSSGEAWLNRRIKMIGDGFAFEYSATFGQAAKDRKIVKDKINDIRKKQAKLLPNKLSKNEIEQLPLSQQDYLNARNQSVFETYSKCVLFDYSYKYFYADGYGKEFHILNMRKEDYSKQDNDRKYFIACLLSFYQQLYLFAQNKDKLTAYNLEKPLWVFVGHTVNHKKLSEDDKVAISDVLQIVEQLAFFLNSQNREQISGWLNDLLNDKSLLLDNKGNPIFYRQFLPLSDFKGNIDALYQDILKRLFNADSPKRLHLHQIKKASGEIALKVGDYDYFALINVGDASGLVKNMNDQVNYLVEDDEFSNGLFHQINHPDSSLNLLIGSRKFTEGWSSWRVSTMGLMNMGRGEGSQIIQLFGRGVRLKGQNFSLRRTPKNQMPNKLWLDKLETLNIFGIQADYMAKFREYLEQEGITPTDEVLTLDFPVQKNLPENVKLKTLQLKDGYRENQKWGFKRKKVIELYQIPKEFAGKIKPIHITLDLYPRLEALSSIKHNRLISDQRQINKLNANIFPFLDWDRIYLELQKLKSERYWSNLKINKEKLRSFVENNTDWYTLYSPNSELEIHSFADIKKQQKILLQLLHLYTEKFYRSLKTAYEHQHFEIVTFDEKNRSFFDGYTIVLEDESRDNRQETLDKLNELAALISEKKIAQAMNWHSPLSELRAICFPQHLFYPLFGTNNRSDLPLKISPVSLVASEIKFIDDLMKAEHSGSLKMWLGDRSLYLIRNADRAEKGLGFSLAGNFYPDFLLWVVDHNSGKQWLNFVDPKGIRNMNLTDPKFGLYQEIKTLQEDIGDSNLILNSFILSKTPYQDLLNNNLSESDLEDKHILLMEKDDYLEKMFGRMK